MQHLSPGDGPTATAPDGSSVDILLRLEGLSTARFVFPPRSVSIPVRHRTVTEIWYFLSGTGRFWSAAGPPDGIEVGPGPSISIPSGEAFQVQSISDDALTAFGVTTPVWPGDGEAEIVEGRWTPTLESGSTDGS